MGEQGEIHVPLWFTDHSIIGVCVRTKSVTVPTFIEKLGTLKNSVAVQLKYNFSMRLVEKSIKGLTSSLPCIPVSLALTQCI